MVPHSTSHRNEVFYLNVFSQTFIPVKSKAINIILTIFDKIMCNMLISFKIGHADYNNVLSLIF